MTPPWIWWMKHDVLVKSCATCLKFDHPGSLFCCFVCGSSTFFFFFLCLFCSMLRVWGHRGCPLRTNCAFGLCRETWLGLFYVHGSLCCVTQVGHSCNTAGSCIGIRGICHEHWLISRLTRHQNTWAVWSRFTTMCSTGRDSLDVELLLHKIWPANHL